MQSKRKKTDVNATAKEMVGDNLSFYASEGYARLRTNLTFLGAGKNNGCRIIGVTSSLRGEGKSTTAINLAYALAKDNKNVILMDGDLRLPTVAEKLGLRQKPGLSNLLIGEQPNVLQKSELNEHLYVIASGELPPNPSELLGSALLGEVLKVLKNKVDYIIMDCPPVGEVSDALVASRYLDGLILVVRRNYATKRVVNATLRQIEQVNAKMLGFVMTYGENFSETFGKYGYYKKGYGYEKQGS